MTHLAWRGAAIIAASPQAIALLGFSQSWTPRKRRFERPRFARSSTGRTTGRRGTSSRGSCSSAETPRSTAFASEAASALWCPRRSSPTRRRRVRDRGAARRGDLSGRRTHSGIREYDASRAAHRSEARPSLTKKNPGRSLAASPRDKTSAALSAAPDCYSRPTSKTTFAAIQQQLGSRFSTR